ncbi:MAG: DNA/RNA non-specific endonuclease [Bacteroidales bacterium]|nr:DNA/RNA non-specific endonuclease [Bacteroidales bacterium]
MKKIAFLIATALLIAGIAYFAATLSAETPASPVPEASATSVSKAGSKKAKEKKAKKQKKTTTAKSPVGEAIATDRNPLLKVIVPAGVANERINHKAYACYFNAQHRIPNCVIYELSATEIALCDGPGAEKRKNYKFYADPLCAASPDWNEYKGSGYDRGHMAPANDMKFDKTAMAECFYMTNMCPQIHALNDGCWRQLENAVHYWAKRDKRVIVAAGPVLKKKMSKIGPDKNISVPGAFYKVIYAPNQGRAIGFIFNNEKITGSYTKHVVSVDYVERMTGLDFFSTVDDALENLMEASTDVQQWIDGKEEK